MPKPIKHILVIRFSSMGDVAMMVPVVKALTEQYNQVKVTILTREFFTPFFRDLPNVSVFAADLKAKHKGISGLYRLSKELKEIRVDAIFDLHNVLRTNVLKKILFKTPFKQINKGRKEKRELINGQRFVQLKTTHQRYADVFAELGLVVNLSNPTFPKPKLLSEKIRRLLNGHKKTIIGIAPFAQYKSKMYPLDKMQEVIKKLSSYYTIILFGGGQEEIRQLSKLASKFDDVISVAGKMTLNEELDLISNLKLMLAMDSGNGHIAAFLGKKVITIWGVTHPFSGFSPFNQSKENNILVNRKNYPKIPTSIYGNKFPKTYENASSSITINEIVEKVLKV